MKSLIYSTPFYCSTWLDSFVGTVLSCVMTICMLISAAVISAGINKLCDRLGRGTFRYDALIVIVSLLLS